MNSRTNLKQISLTWRPPKELERSRPREVRLSEAGKALACLAVALILGGFVAGLALYVKASRDQLKQAQFLESGTDGEATITRRWSAGRDPVRYWVEYAYRVEGQTYMGRLPIGRNSWLSLERAGTLSVRYMPADPRLHFVHGFDAKLLPPWVSILVAGVLFFVAWLLTRILASQRRLLAEGRPVPALVTRISRTQHGNGKVAHYVFMAMSGKLINGKSNPQKSPPAAGSVLNVIYEPDQENHNSIYPLSLVKTRRQSGYAEFRNTAMAGP